MQNYQHNVSTADGWPLVLLAAVFELASDTILSDKPCSHGITVKPSTYMPVLHLHASRSSCCCSLSLACESAQAGVQHAQHM